MNEMPATPDVTKNQIIALLVFLASQAVAWGWVTGAHAQWGISVGGILIPIALKFADAHLRGKRAIAWAIANSGQAMQLVEGSAAAFKSAGLHTDPDIAPLEGTRVVVKEDTTAAKPVE